MDLGHPVVSLNIRVLTLLSFLALQTGREGGREASRQAGRQAP